MILLSVVAAALLVVMTGVAVWNLLTAPRLEWFDLRFKPRRVSVLIPARNEAANLSSAIPALLRIDDPELEILVLDDESTDETAAVVASFANGDARLRLLTGRPLPGGWLGKNWACHQLAEAAGGDILVFCDADVVVRPDAVGATLSAMEATGADALTAFPRQRFSGWLDAAVVPLITQLPILATLPLSLVPRTRSPLVAAGNGQWFAFTRAAYETAGGHAGIRSDVVEDIALARRLKAGGKRLVAVVANPSLQVRMYRDRRGLHEGFVKNLYALAGGRPIPFGIAFLVTALVLVYPWVGFMTGASGAAQALALLLLLRIAGLLLFDHSLRSVLAHPLGSLWILVLALESCAATQKGRTRWKGRTIPLEGGELDMGVRARAGPQVPEVGTAGEHPS